MGLFDGLDVAAAADNPFEVEDGTYTCTVTSAEAGPTKAGDKVGILIEYTINDVDSPMYERKVSEWKQIPQPADPQNLTPDESRALSFLKQRLTNLGIPEDRMNTMDADDLIGIDCVVSVKKKGEYTNVVKVSLPTDSDTGVTFS